MFFYYGFEVQLEIIIIHSSVQCAGIFAIPGNNDLTPVNSDSSLPLTVICDKISDPGNMVIIYNNIE